MASNQFLSRYAAEVRRSMVNDYDDNHDVDRFGRETNRPSAAYRMARWLAWRAGLVPVGEVESALSSSLALLEGNIGNLEWLHANLADNGSKQLLVLLAAYRALGHRRVKLPVNNSKHQSDLQRVKDMSKNAEILPVAFHSWNLRRMELSKEGFPLTLYATAPAVVTQFIEQQYRCEAEGQVIEAEDGDFVIDAGGCWGDTALYFADRIGESGRVLSCEFLEENLSVYRKNLALNPRHAPRIDVVPKALWSKSGHSLSFCANGPGTSVASASADQQFTVETITIDDLIKEKYWPKVDFIKMDIEGAELEALRGAELALRKYRPKLAITVYHRFSDFWQIPQFLHGLDLGYRYYLRHFKIHAEETVLFAHA